MGLADLILTYVPFPDVPRHYTSYVPGKTPMSSTPTVITTLIGYLVLVFSIQEFQRPRQPQKLNTLFRIHNVILSGGSALLLALMLEEIVPIVWKHGFYASICAESSWTPVCEIFMLKYTLELIHS
jgi:fatty acid elongase 3